MSAATNRDVEPPGGGTGAATPAGVRTTTTIKATKKRIAVAVCVMVALATAVVEYARTGEPLEALEAGAAGALAVGIAGYALSLRGIDWRGLVVGGFFVAAGILSWTFSETKLVVWGFLAAEGVAFAIMNYPWLRKLSKLPRLGGAWLGLAYWLLGIVGAGLMLNTTVAVQRIAYLGVFTLAVLAVLAARRSDLTVGITVAFLLAIAALVLAGSGNLFDAHHAVPETAWGNNMNRRFWGGEWLLYHPNSLALIGVVIAIRIAPDPSFARWQRLAALCVGGAVVYATNSRTGFLFALVAATVHAALMWWRSRGRRVDGLGTYARPWLAAAAPFLVLALILILSGGKGFIIKERYGGEGGLTSGRLDTWKQVVTEWRAAGVAEKAFGDTSDSRATVRRESSGPDTKLTTDNAAVGALRRGGVLGVMAFLTGLALLLVRAVWPVLQPSGRPFARRPPPAPAAWFTITAIGALPTIATADWLLGGTGGTLWILLLAAETALLFVGSDEQDPTPAETPWEA